MQRRWIHNLLVCVALAAAWFAPLRARAAILPACENHVPVTEVAPAAPVAGGAAEAPDVDPTACRSTPDPREGAGGANEAIDTGGRFAPMCDVRGASTEAPPRIHPIGDERIEAVPSCEHGLSSPTAVGPSPHEMPSLHDGAALADHAVLPSSFLVAPAAIEEAPDFLPPRDETRPGERRRVDHPPR